MADLRLTWPEGGRTVAVESTEHTRFVFDFPSADAVVSRDGGDLVFSFSDGASFRVSNFYTTYHLENMPEFVLDGLAVAGEAFFTALGDEDLMPAADAEALAADARFRDWADGALADGLDKLAGLDLDPEEGPAPIRSGSVVEGVSLAASGVDSGFAGGAGGPLGSPDPVPGPGPDPDPEPGPGPGPGPGPDPDPEPDPEPDPDPNPEKPTLTIIPHHTSEFAMDAYFEVHMSPPPGVFTTISVDIFDSFTGKTEPGLAYVYEDGSGYLYAYNYRSYPGVYRGDSTIEVTVTDDAYGGQTTATLNVANVIVPAPFYAWCEKGQDENGVDVIVVKAHVGDGWGSYAPMETDVVVEVWIRERISGGSYQHGFVTIPVGQDHGEAYFYDLDYDMQHYDPYIRLVNDPDNPYPGNFDQLVPSNWLGVGLVKYTGGSETEPGVFELKVETPAPNIVLTYQLQSPDGSEIYGYHTVALDKDNMGTLVVPCPFNTVYKDMPLSGTYISGHGPFTLMLHEFSVDGDIVPIDKLGGIIGWNTVTFIGTSDTTEAAIALAEESGQLWAAVSLTTASVDSEGKMLDTSPGFRSPDDPYTTTLSCIITINGVGYSRDIVLSGDEWEKKIAWDELGLPDLKSGDTVTARVIAFAHDEYAFEGQAFAAADTIVFPDLQAPAGIDPANLMLSYDELLFGIESSSAISGEEADGVTVAGGCYDAAETMSANGEIDFLIGPDAHFLDTLLNAHTLEDGTRHIHVEVASGSPHTDVFLQADGDLNLTSMADLTEKLGITIANDHVSLDEQWEAMAEQTIDGNDYMQWQHHNTAGDVDATILVQKSILENTQS